MRTTIAVKGDFRVETDGKLFYILSASSNANPDMLWDVCKTVRKAMNKFNKIFRYNPEGK